MQERISPYALLKASKPKPSPSQASTYDLFSSAVQNYKPDSAEKPAPLSDRSPEQSAEAPRYIPLPEKKTHYIADIHARHSTADRRAGQNLRTL